MAKSAGKRVKETKNKNKREAEKEKEIGKSRNAKEMQKVLHRGLKGCPWIDSMSGEGWPIPVFIAEWVELGFFFAQKGDCKGGKREMVLLGTILPVFTRYWD